MSVILLSCIATLYLDCVFQAKNKVRLTIILLVIGLGISDAKAQICTAENTKGCGHVNNGDIFEIIFGDFEIKNLKCSGSAHKASCLNQNKPIRINENSIIQLYVNYQTTRKMPYTKIGVWIDYNRNDTFEASECLIDPSSVSSSYLSTSIKIACVTDTGLSKIRIRGFSTLDTLVGAKSGCGKINASGSIYDLEIRLSKLGTPNAAFLMDTFNKFTNDYINAKVAYPLAGMSYMWAPSKSNLTQLYGDNGLINYYNWNSVGTHSVKLIATNSCNGQKDSTIQVVKLKSPITVPDFDFKIRLSQTPIYDVQELYGILSNGTTETEWEFTTPSTKYKMNANLFNSRKLVILADEIGKWKVCARAKNNIGWGKRTCKSYTVIGGWEFLIGLDSQVIDHNYGRLVIGGGNSNYANNCKPETTHFRIKNQGLSTVLSIDLFKMADTFDRLKIYNGLNNKGAPLHPPGGFTSANIGNLPAAFISDSGYFYITFESNSSGNDEGFILSWKPKIDLEIVANVYWDVDSNCVFDPVKDIPMEGITVKSSKSKYVKLTDENGNVFLYTDSISTVLKPILNKDFYFSCPASGEDTWTYAKNGEYIYFAVRSKFKKDTSKNPSKKVNTKIDVYPVNYNNAKRGFKNEINLKLSNIGVNDIDTLDCYIKRNFKLDSLSLWTADYYHDDSIIKFSITNLKAQKHSIGKYSFKVPATDSGTIKFSCGCFPKNSGKETDSTNNVYDFGMKIVYAHDPNDKMVAQEENFTNKENTFNYRIRFQNTGTAAAENVIVRDTLSEYLDSSTVELVNTSHNCILEQKGRYLAFKFMGIFLQDSNTNEPQSHGHINYKVNSKNNIPGNAIIKNTAFIYFDFEKPVVTNTTQNKYTPFPKLNLIGAPIVLTKTCVNYADSGALANDEVDGNLTSKIVVLGKVITNKIQSDTLKYTVTNSNGLKASVIRIVKKQDATSPEIRRNNYKIVNNMNIKVHVLSNFTDSVNTWDSCLVAPPLTMVPVFNGPVNTSTIGMYPIQYFTHDTSGNYSNQNGYTINYLVNDYIAPTIQLNTTDTVYIKVNTPYTSVTPSISDNYWPSNGISILKSGTVNSNQIGVYKEVFTATDNSGNKSSKTRTVIVGDYGATQFANRISTLRIFPNPANNYFDIELKNNTEKTANIKVLNLQGKEYLNLVGASTDKRIRISTQNFTAGIYLIQINNQVDLKNKVVVIHN